MKVKHIDGILCPIEYTRNCERSAFPVHLEPTIWYGTDDIDDRCIGPMVQQLHLDDANFWKNRTVAYMLAASHVVSISFIPSEGTEREVLFVQKEDLVKKTIGFVAPYLNNTQQMKIGAIPQLPKHYRVTSEDEIDQTLSGIRSPSIIHELKSILVNFLLDSKTSQVAITYQDDLKQIFTSGWTKI